VETAKSSGVHTKCEIEEVDGKQAEKSDGNMTRQEINEQ
jgi:hypothetical protein